MRCVDVMFYEEAVKQPASLSFEPQWPAEKNPLAFLQSSLVNERGRATEGLRAALLPAVDRKPNASVKSFSARKLGNSAFRQRSFVWRARRRQQSSIRYCEPSLSKRRSRRFSYIVRPTSPPQQTRAF